ncbi:MAG: MFS transporter [Anaerolineaceae bacterium]|nr:MAG: MFS transporter [Anaerolineaceae bacterium]
MTTFDRSGFRGFLILWLGQFVSLIGTGMTRFAVTIWAFEQTGSAQVLALVGAFSFGPLVIFGPLAGALVDRWHRKTVLIMSNLGAGLVTVALFTLFSTGQIEIWHLYVAGAITGLFESFQFPAFSATTTLMLSKAHYARAHGLMSLAESVSTIIAPILAGLILVMFDLWTVMMIDIVTFSFAVVAIAFVAFPALRSSQAGLDARSNLVRETWYGFAYILKRPSLLGLQMMFFAINLSAGAALVMIAPMVLASTGNNEIALSTVQAAMGVGGVVGGLIMTAWGGPRERVHGIFIGMSLSGLLGLTVIGLGANVLVWAVGAFLFMLFVPVMNASNQAIWQVKVEPDLQGKVFAVRRFIAQGTLPIAMLTAGFLADNVLEPAMQPDGSLAPVLGNLLGTTPGSGIALLFVTLGLIATFIGLIGYAVPAIRHAETILPDFVELEDRLPTNDIMPEAGTAIVGEPTPYSEPRS